VARTIDTAKKAIEERVREIDAERKQLETALQALTGEDGKPKPRRRASNGRRRRKQAPRGQRRTQVMASLKKSPGLRPRDLAKKHGMASSQVSTLLKQLTEAGEVEKKDGHYFPKQKRAARKS
jgi:predicted Rossmann fold nucleotide-binding protein DprA/Smf involved in DNA uptake